MRFRCHLVTSAAHCPFSNVARHCLWRVSSNPPLFKPPIKTNTSLFTQHALFRVSIYIVVCRLWPTGTNGLNLPWTLSTSDLSHNRLGTRRPPTQTHSYTHTHTPHTHRDISKNRFLHGWSVLFVFPCVFLWTDYCGWLGKISLTTYSHHTISN